MGTFKLFEEHAGMLRQQYPDGLKCSIKFDDVEMSLVMDVKIPTNTKWQRVNRHQIEKAGRMRRTDPQSSRMNSEDDRREINTVLLVDHVNSGGIPVVEEEEEFEDANTQ